MTIEERRAESWGVARITHAIPTVAFVRPNEAGILIARERASLEETTGRRLRLLQAYDDRTRAWTVLQFEVVDRD